MVPVNDQHLVRGALAALLCLEDDIDVVAEVAGVQDALTLIQLWRPGVVLLDIEMQGRGRRRRRTSTA